MVPHPQQAGPKTPSWLKAREKGGISSLRVLFSLWMRHYKCMRTLECVFKRKYSVQYIMRYFFVLAHTLPWFYLYIVFSMLFWTITTVFFFFITRHNTSSVLQYIKGDFVGIFKYLILNNSILLHLPPLRFHCLEGCWYWTQDSCEFWHWQSDDLTLVQRPNSWTKSRQ